MSTLLVVMGAAACAGDGSSREARAGGEAQAGRAEAPRTGRAPTDEAAGRPAVRSGIEVLIADSLHLVSGRRVGLVTNHTGLARAPEPGASESVRSSIDVLWEHPQVELAALFGPEHGLRGTAEAGEHVASGRDERTGLPVHSLYSDTRRPPAESLEGLEALLFDIQDVGARYYTYIYTMALAMEAAGRAGIPFVVLDRPNPVGGVLVQGNVLDPAFASFVGMYPIPMRHGMTPGELARLFRGEFGVGADLRVVPADGWRRQMTFEATELPWVAPSPNMPDLASALHYPGTCLFEGTNLSVARGTDRPFQQVGAPWLDGPALAAALEAHELPGVRFEAVRFTPRDPGDGKFGDTEVEGVRFVATDASIYDPTRAAVAALVEARRMSGERWQWRASHFDRLAGTEALRLGLDRGLPPEALTAGWDAERTRFMELRQKYLLYP